MQPAPQNQLDPLWLFILAFSVAAMAGVARLLRTSQLITFRLFLSAILNSGALGLCMALLLFTWFKDNTWFLLGLCLLAGLGGMTALGFILSILRQGGITLDIHVKDKDKGKGTEWEGDKEVNEEGDHPDEKPEQKPKDRK